MRPTSDTKLRNSLMYGPRVLASMALALIAFAVVTYIATGSIGTTVLRTFLCALLIQAGYFIGVLILVRREAKLRAAEVEAGSRRLRDLDQGSPQMPVSSMNEPHSQA